MAFVVYYLLVGFFFKSVLFADGENTLLYYLCSIIPLPVLLIAKIKNRFYFPPIIGIVLIFLAILVGLRNGYEAIYISLYILSLILFSIVLPQLVYSVSTFKKIFTILATWIFLLSLGALAVPSIGFDPIDGRFRGVFVSVAYATNFYPFLTVICLSKDNSLNSSIRKVLVSMGLLFSFLTYSKGALFLLTLIFFDSLVLRSKVSKVFKVLISILFLFGFTFLINLFSDRFVRHETAEDGFFGNRTLNWLIAGEAIKDNLFIGKSFIYKYTEGGTKTVELGNRNEDTSSSYNQAYDPHSMFLLWMIQGGVIYVFCILCFLFYPFYLLWKSGLDDDVDRFILYNLVFMLIFGGDLSSFGNHYDKIILFIVGLAFVKYRRSKNIGLNENYC